MKVILKQDVKGLGKAGQTVNVAEGYARNFLLPRGLATEASTGALRSLANQKQAEKLREEREAQSARAVKDKLNGQTITLQAKAGDAGRLFGAITSKDIAAALTRSAGIPIDKKRIELKEPIKALGEYEITVRLGFDLLARVKVVVTGE